MMLSFSRSGVMTTGLGLLLLAISWLSLASWRTGLVWAACQNGDWRSEWVLERESWNGDYGSCANGRLRCHSMCEVKKMYECVGGSWQYRWIESGRCRYDYVCRDSTGGDSSCSCCGGGAAPPPPAKSHLECRQLACQSVPGAGQDQCTRDRDCFHQECRGMQCRKVKGGGANECTANSHCWHLACEDLTCQKQPSSSRASDPPDTCGVDEDCWHQECQTDFAVCKKVPSLGQASDPPDECRKDADCSGPTCHCQWVAKACGGGGCSITERLYVYEDCDPPGCSSDSLCQVDPECGSAGGGSWLQTSLGEVGLRSTIRMLIPSTPLPFSEDFEAGPYFSLGQPSGAILVGDSFGPSLGSGQPAQAGWLIKDYPLASKLSRYDYSFFETNWRPDRVFSKDASLSGGQISGWEVGDGSVIRVEGNLQVTDGDNLEGKKVLVLVSGRLEFLGDVDPDRAAVVFVSLGSVRVGTGVNKVRAVILSNGQITESAESSPASAGLLWEGMFWTNGGVDSYFALPRQREDSAAPVEMFAYDPGMLVELTSAFGRPRLSWREVVAGKE